VNAPARGAHDDATPAAPRPKISGPDDLRRIFEERSGGGARGSTKKKRSGGSSAGKSRKSKKPRR
jgi:hypothetical protein